MEDSDYIKIYTGSFIITQRIVDQLEAVGINAIVKDESESARLAGFGASIQGEQEVFVTKEEEAAAQDIINALLSEFNA
ncbi:DUF2007 domain-containing protein [Formosa sp. A9]|uniref:DUF2007 domain-containing protein n=1 Tax=Formosa sp. A9 TaxID=3442641 RepID=UPI003EC0F94C